MDTNFETIFLLLAFPSKADNTSFHFSGRSWVQIRAVVRVRGGGPEGTGADGTQQANLAEQRQQPVQVDRRATKEVLPEEVVEEHPGAPLQV